MKSCGAEGKGVNKCLVLQFILNLMSIFSMFFSYRGGVDSEGRPVMVVVGAHFLLRCLDLERFIHYVVKVVQH